MKLNKVFLYYFMTFVICWGVAALFILAPDSMEAMFGPMSLTNPVFIFYAFVPTILAIFFSWFLEGREGVKEWLKRCFKWRANPVWYIIVILGIPGLAYLAAYLSGQDLNFDPNVLFISIFPGILIGPISEEPGWHGYALPKLLGNNNLLKAGLITGILWGIWHLPAYIISGTSQESGNPIEAYVGFCLIALGLNIIQAWLFSRTGGSALISGIICHLAYNTSMSLTGDPHLWMGILMLLSAVCIVIMERDRFLLPGKINNTGN